MGVVTYNRNYVSILCRIGTSTAYDNFYGETVVIIKDERPVKPIPLSNTDMQIERIIRNTGTIVNGSRSGSVAFAMGSISPTYTVEQTSASDLVTIAKARLGQGKFNAGVALVELDDTVGLIGKTGRRLLNAIAALKRGDLKHLSKLLGKPSRRQLARAKSALASGRTEKNLSSAWLEYSFGWRPLLNDIYGAIDAYHEGLTTRGSTVRGAAGSRTPYVSYVGNNYNFRPVGWGNGTSYTRNPLKGRELARRAVFYGTVRNPTLRSLQELGLINPAHLAWQKVPYSFVIDWLLPIGSLLAGLTAGAGLYGVRGYSLYEWRETKTRSWAWQNITQKIYRDNHTASDLSIGLRINDLSAWHLGTSFSLMSQRLR